MPMRLNMINVSCSHPQSSNNSKSSSSLSYKVRLEYIVVYRIYHMLLNTFGKVKFWKSFGSASRRTAERVIRDTGHNIAGVKCVFSCRVLPPPEDARVLFLV